ncbi:MAG: hypothetical protein ABDI19_02305 [Armatimonadota bacterium]
MKPIPENRRWQEERARHPEGQPPVPIQEDGVVVVVVGPPVIPARYAGTCPACRNAIEPGMPITLHTHLSRWVHLECRNMPLQQVSTPARYPGRCRACLRPIQVGEMIAWDATHRWVHQECLRNHLIRVDHRATLAEIEELYDELLDDELLDIEELLNDWEEEDVG